MSSPNVLRMVELCEMFVSADFQVADVAEMAKLIKIVKRELGIVTPAPDPGAAKVFSLDERRRKKRVRR